MSKVVHALREFLLEIGTMILVGSILVLTYLSPWALALFSFFIFLYVVAVHMELNETKKRLSEIEETARQEKIEKQLSETEAAQRAFKDRKDKTSTEET